MSLFAACPGALQGELRGGGEISPRAEFRHIGILFKILECGLRPSGPVRPVPEPFKGSSEGRRDFTRSRTEFQCVVVDRPEGNIIQHIVALHPPRRDIYNLNVTFASVGLPPPPFQGEPLHKIQRKIKVSKKFTYRCRCCVVVLQGCPNRVAMRGCRERRGGGSWNLVHIFLQVEFFCLYSENVH